MCIHCKRPIERNNENYVIVNKDAANYASD